MVFIWFLYGSSAHGCIVASVQTTRLNHGCIMGAHAASTV